MQKKIKFLHKKFSFTEPKNKHVFKENLKKFDLKKNVGCIKKLSLY